MATLEPQKLLQLVKQSLHLVAYAGLALDIEKRQVLGYLRCIDIELSRYGGRRNILDATLVEKCDVCQIPRQTAQRRLRNHRFVSVFCRRTHNFFQRANIQNICVSANSA